MKEIIFCQDWEYNPVFFLSVGENMVLRGGAKCDKDEIYIKIPKGISKSKPWLHVPHPENYVG